MTQNSKTKPDFSDLTKLEAATMLINTAVIMGQNYPVTVRAGRFEGQEVIMIVIEGVTSGEDGGIVLAEAK